MLEILWKMAFTFFQSPHLMSSVRFFPTNGQKTKDFLIHCHIWQIKAANPRVWGAREYLAFSLEKWLKRSVCFWNSCWFVFRRSANRITVYSLQRFKPCVNSHSPPLLAGAVEILTEDMSKHRWMKPVPAYVTRGNLIHCVFLCLGKLSLSLVNFGWVVFF